MNSQVLLLQPWVEDFYTTDCRVQPIGLAYLAGSLKRRFAGLDVQIFDTLAGGEKKTIPWPAEFRYLKPYFGAPDHGHFSLFHQYYRFGKSETAILQRLTIFQPFLIGISCLFTPYYRQSLALACLCRRVFPNVPIVMGGNHATMHPQSLLSPPNPFNSKLPLCDYVLRGEGEQSLCELVEHLRGRRSLGAVSNLVVRQELITNRYTSSGIAMENEETNAPAANSLFPIPPQPEFLGQPDFTGLEQSHYHFGERPMTFLVTSRSCPHRCSFCSIHAVFGWHYQNRPIDEVIEQIRIRYAQGIRHFDIEDDNFTYNTRHTHLLLDRVIQEGLPVSFSAMNGLSYLSLDCDLLAKMKQAGFDSLNISLVSGGAEAQRFSRRPHALAKFKNILELAEEIGFRVTAYCILGMPGQTVEEMWATLCLLAESRCLMGASPFYFTPGSPLHAQEKGNPKIRLASQGRDPFFSARLTALDLECADFSREDVYTCFRLSRVINYIKAGLDIGHASGHPYFQPAEKVLASGNWYAESKHGNVPLPFSPRIKEIVHCTPMTIRGYKTSRSLRWEPHRNSSALL